MHQGVALLFRLEYIIPKNKRFTWNIASSDLPKKLGASSKQTTLSESLHESEISSYHQQSPPFTSFVYWGSRDISNKTRQLRLIFLST